MIQEKLLRAIAIRDGLTDGTIPKAQRENCAVELYRHEIWNYQHIANICGGNYYTIRRMLAKEKYQLKPLPDSVTGGKFNPATLDLILLLVGNVARNEEPSRELVGKIANMGTSTRVLSRLTGITIGRILYAQSQYEKENKEITLDNL